MRLAIIYTLIAGFLVSAAPVVRRDMNGAVAAFNTIPGSANDAALVANTNTFFTNMKGVADSKDLEQASKQVSDQIKANNKNKVPTSQTAAWVASVLQHFVS
ncbi:hypothetical protein LPJ56_000727 [Coemansia sp. RSA 2599]|nr:hypothetical protein LPJ75_000510 [Coemansia sp. RSA 2598]KAJ1828998.1 hypothetical protein LPJ56_000727 [Coemansia sp. RSA 2599]